MLREGLLSGRATLLGEFKGDQRAIRLLMKGHVSIRKQQTSAALTELIYINTNTRGSQHV